MGLAGVIGGRRGGRRCHRRRRQDPNVAPPGRWSVEAGAVVVAVRAVGEEVAEDEHRVAVGDAPRGATEQGGRVVGGEGARGKADGAFGIDRKTAGRIVEAAHAVAGALNVERIGERIDVEAAAAGIGAGRQRRARAVAFGDLERHGGCRQGSGGDQDGERQAEGGGRSGAKAHGRFRATMPSAWQIPPGGGSTSFYGWGWRASMDDR